MELTTLFDRAVEAGRRRPAFDPKQRMSQAAEQLNRAGTLQAQIGVVEGALVALINVLYATDADGQPANYDAVTGRILIPLPWGSSGWKHWGLRKMEAQQWHDVLNINLDGVFNMCRHVVDAMCDRNFGRIVNIGSVHSIVASKYKSAYVSAKHGLVGFSKVMALETADNDITINTVCPAYVKTPLVDKQIADQARTHGIPEAQVVKEIMLKPMPKATFITFEELAGICAFLIGPAARNITGQTIVVDGGWTVQ